MVAIDVTRAYENLLAREEDVQEAIRVSVQHLGDRYPVLAEGVARLLRNDLSQTSIFRLLPFPVVGALGGDPGVALPLVVSSRIWWTGAEVFDDLSDGQYNPAIAGLSASEALVASTACLAVVPIAFLAEQPLPPRFVSGWTREFLDSSLRAAEGQLTDVASDTAAPTWTNVMQMYAGKSGSPYARDSVMAARMAGVHTSQLRGWRAFGQLFGVLRQLVNDQAAKSPEADEDLINGTSTLLLAHVAETITTAIDSDIFASLRLQARQNPTARVRLNEILRDPNMSSTYNRRIRSIHAQLSALLDSLAPRSEHRDLLQWMLNVSVRDSQVEHQVSAK